jgi:ATP-binding cassette subfamily F protein 3
VVIVSHDRFLLDATCDRLWLVANGAVKPFDGDIDDYAKLVVQARKTAKTGETHKDPGFEDDEEEVAWAETRTAPARPPKEVEKLESQIAKLTDLIAKVDEALAKPDVFRKNPEIATQLARDRANLADKLSKAEEEWLAVSG